MALVLTQEGGLRLWLQILGLGTIGQPFAHLLGSPFTPSHSSTYADYAAAELGVAGYSPQQVSNAPGQWAFGPVTAGQQAVHLALPFGMTVDCTIYGYWIADSANTYALWGDLFSTPWSYDHTIPPFYLTLVPNLISVP
jgi:hypothetical protein